MILTSIEQIAKTCHEVNRAFCQRIGDFSQVSWDDAPEWQKESAKKGVEYYIENQDATPNDIHDNWVRDKIADGWKFGVLKNPDKKEHPCICTYEQLSDDQRTKDHLFVAVVKSFMPKI